MAFSFYSESLYIRAIFSSTVLLTTFLLSNIHRVSTHQLTRSETDNVGQCIEKKQTISVKVV